MREEHGQHKTEQETSEQKHDRDPRSESRLQEEIAAGEWQRLGEFETYKKRTRQGKIIAMIDAITNRVVQLERMFYPLVRNHPKKAVKLLAEIKRLRVLKEYLLQCLIWEERGEVEYGVPQELEDLL